MILPLGDTGVASGLLCGFLFGFVMENAGFSSARKLTAQFELRDWTLFKVMFSAILVAAAGLDLVRWLGWMPIDKVLVPTSYLWATVTGGGLVGAGFVIGGYCPGTSVVACATGRIDGLVFLAGLVSGTLAFAGAYEFLGGMLDAGRGPYAQTLAQLFGVPEWVVFAVLCAVAAGGFWLGGRFEQRTGGLVTAKQTLSLIHI